MYAGGFGSAKTSTCATEFIEAALRTPNGLGLIGAQTLPQLENTAKLELKNMLTTELIKHERLQKNEIILINGYRIIFRPLDDPDKFKSLNLTHFWIEEASDVALTIFIQLKTRLRNNVTKDHFGILSTNPSMGWIKSEFLLQSQSIKGGTVDYSNQMNAELNPFYSTHISETAKNKYLPKDFIEMNSKGKEQWWINRFLNASFENKEGNVYPQWEDSLVQPFEIPKHWEKIQGSDFGINDPTVALWGAIDPKTGTTYICDEHYESGKAVPHHAIEMKKRLDTIPFGRLRFVVGDPSGQNRSHSDMRSVFEHYAEHGVYFQAGMNKLEDGVYKVHAFFELGILKIFSSCRNTIKEIQEYRYPENSDTRKTNIGDKPIDKDNHAMDALRYMIAELPDNPKDLINKSYSFYVENSQKIEYDSIPHALQDDEMVYNEQEWGSYY